MKQRKEKEQLTIETFNDVMRYRGTALFYLKLSNSLLLKEPYVDLLENKYSNNRSHVFGRSLWSLIAYRMSKYENLVYQSYKPLFPKLTRNKLHTFFQEAYERHDKRKSNSFSGKRGVTNPNYGGYIKDRLYPLSQKYYNQIATKIYERAGSPKFGKRVFTGVHMGRFYLSTFTYHGLPGKIASRWVGVEISPKGFRIEAF